MWSHAGNHHIPPDLHLSIGALVTGMWTQFFHHLSFIIIFFLLLTLPRTILCCSGLITQPVDSYLLRLQRVRTRNKSTSARSNPQQLTTYSAHKCDFLQRSIHHPLRVGLTCNWLYYSLVWRLMNRRGKWQQIVTIQQCHDLTVNIIDSVTFHLALYGHFI